MASHTKDSSFYYAGRGWHRNTELGHDYGFSRTRKIFRTRTGQGVPNWKQKIASHQSATSPLTGVFETVITEGWISDHLSYRWDAVNGWGGKQQYEDVVGNCSLYNITPDQTSDLTLDTSVNGKASNKYLSEARRLTTRMDGGTFLGELKQTLRMLRHPAEALTRSINGYYDALSKRKRKEQQHRRRKGLPELPKDSSKWEWHKAIPDLWLEYSFGWVPLMADIEDAWETLSSLSNSESVVHISKGAQGKRLRFQSFSPALLLPPSTVNRLRADKSQRIESQTTIRYRGDVTAQAATTFADQAARWGFTPSQFLPTAWELLPWSFLVDYFASIGDFLDASFTNTAALKWTSKSIRRRCTTEYLLTPNRYETMKTFPPAAQATYSSSGYCLCKYTRTEVDRQPYGAPIPSVVFVDFQDQSSRHLANMSALFGSFCNGLHSQNPSPRNFRR